MRLWPFAKTEHRASLSTDIADYQQSVAAGSSGTPRAVATAAVATATRAISAPFTIATVPEPLTGPLMADLVSRLMTTGNAVYRILLSDDGRLDLEPRQ